MPLPAGNIRRLSPADGSRRKDLCHRSFRGKGIRGGRFGPVTAIQEVRWSEERSSFEGTISMRYAIPVLAAFFLLAFSVGFLATRPLTPAKARGPIYSASADKIEHDDGWRRTAAGWEHRSTWETAARSSSAGGVERLHPLVVAALLLLVGVGALVANDTLKQDSSDTRLAKFIPRER